MDARGNRFPALLGLLILSCGAPASELDETVVRIGEVTVSLSELKLYLALNLLPGEGTTVPDPEGLDRVKSRLLDALVDEKALAAEALRRGLQVSQREIDAYLGDDTEYDQEKTALSRAQREELARQRLLVQKLQVSSAPLPAPPESTVRAHIRQSEGRLAPQKRVRLRALRFESPEDAAKVTQDIARGSTSFAEAVLTYETGPGQGVLIEMSWDNLTDDLRGTLGDLQTGEVSPPVDFHGETYLFQLEAWLTEPTVMDKALADRAREELALDRRRKEEEELLRRLRRQTPVEIHRDRLPFRYLPES